MLGNSQLYPHSSFFIGLGFGTKATAQERYYPVDLNSKTLTYLSTLSGESAVVNDINDAGQVVEMYPTANGVATSTVYV